MFRIYEDGDIRSCWRAGPSDPWIICGAEQIQLWFTKSKVSRFKEHELIFNHATTRCRWVEVLSFMDSNGPKTMMAHTFPMFDHWNDLPFHSRTFSLVLKWYINIWTTSTHHPLTHLPHTSLPAHTLPLCKSLIVCKSHHHHHSACLSTDVDRLHIL